jgi:hypothetical protein
MEPMMRALLVFHLRAGARIAIRSFAPLFSTFLALIILNVDPVGTVIGFATALFSRRPTAAVLAPIVLLAFVLPAWAAPKLVHGHHGWIRHLSFTGTANRRGVALALAVIQAPLAVSLGCLAWVAFGHGLGIVTPIMRMTLLLAAGTLAALPVRRKIVTIPAAVASALMALTGGWNQMLPAAAVMVAAEAVSGPLCVARPRNPWRAAGSWLDVRIAWRALGWRLVRIYAIALLPLVITYLFLRNNDLPPSLAAGAVRLGGSMTVVLVLTGLVANLAERRPAWPWARSLSWSSSRRILSDSLFLGFHSILFLPILAVQFPASAACILGLLPFLALRAAGHVRQVPGLRTAGGRFLMEGFFLGALLSLQPWISILCLAAAPVAFGAARASERNLKVTCWSDLHHAAFGDTLSWSE